MPGVRSPSAPAGGRRASDRGRGVERGLEVGLDLGVVRGEDAMAGVGRPRRGRSCRACLGSIGRPPGRRTRRLVGRLRHRRCRPPLPVPPACASVPVGGRSARPGSVAVAHRLRGHLEVALQLRRDVGRGQTSAIAARMWTSQRSRSAGPIANGRGASAGAGGRVPGRRSSGRPSTGRGTASGGGGRRRGPAPGRAAGGSGRSRPRRRSARRGLEEGHAAGSLVEARRRRSVTPESLARSADPSARSVCRCHLRGGHVQQEEGAEGDRQETDGIHDRSIRGRSGAGHPANVPSRTGHMT